MRKFIVKYFALDYRLGSINFSRSASIIFPLMILTGVLWKVNSPSILALFSFCLLLISLYFGFLYFPFHPVEWNELDTFQKWQYGLKNKLTKYQRQEWEIIDKLLQR